MERLLLLEVRSGPDAGRSFVVAHGPDAIVGRMAPSNVVLSNDPTISRRHFSISFDGRSGRITDLGSSHGTTVNGVDVTEGLVVHGDLIGAGTTLIRLRIVDTVPPGAQIISVAPPPASSNINSAVASPSSLERPSVFTSTPGLTAEDRVLSALRGQERPLFAILDAARDPVVHLRILQCPEKKRSLYEGPEAADLDFVAPHLLELPKGSPFVDLLVRESWGQSWGVFLTSDRTFDEVRKHLRRHLKVELPDRRLVLFRFYDPRVLKGFLPTCNAEEFRTFMGPVSSWLVEDDGSLLRFRAAGAGQASRPDVLVEPTVG